MCITPCLSKDLSDGWPNLLICAVGAEISDFSERGMVAAGSRLYRSIPFGQMATRVRIQYRHMCVGAEGANLRNASPDDESCNLRD
jgi:hypothetical protein